MPAAAVTAAVVMDGLAGAAAVVVAGLEVDASVVAGLDLAPQATVVARRGAAVVVVPRVVALARPRGGSGWPWAPDWRSPQARRSVDFDGPDDGLAASATAAVSISMTAAQNAIALTRLRNMWSDLLFG